MHLNVPSRFVGICPSGHQIFAFTRALVSALVNDPRNRGSCRPHPIPAFVSQR